MDIRIKRLHMENFKCHKSLTLDFDGRDASIYGDNATGKTSVYDAFVWLLFGKDSAGNGEKNIDIKPLAEDGSVLDHNAVTEVEAVLLADGEELSLRRTYRELWSTKRGSSEATYDGNTSEYFVDGVPCKANLFKSRVSELVDEDRFRLLTTVSYFPAALPWQKRRETLFDLFGAMDDRQIMETDERFTPLLGGMGKLPLEDFKKLVAQRRKGYLTTRNEIPARISECEKTIEDLSTLDFDGADREIGVLTSRLEELNKELLSIEQSTAIQKKQMELQQTKMELDKLEADNRLHRNEQRAKAPDTSAIAAKLESARGILSGRKRSLSLVEEEIRRCEQAISDARERWKTVNAEQYSGSGFCPTCGQRLPEGKINSAAAAFAQDKKRRLDALVRDSKRYKENNAQYAQNRAETEEAVRNLETEIGDLEKKLAAARESAAAMEISDMPGYAENREFLQGWISSFQEELKALQEDAGGAAMAKREQIRKIQDEISSLRGISGKRSAYAYAQQRIQKLRLDAQEAADNLSQMEHLQFLMEEYSRYKASFLESGINGQFHLAKFRLFREQANGGVEDRCDVTHDGVPYLGLNNGMKINVGLDIINTLSRAYGVTVPLFVDNAESVTNLEKCDCQVIRLAVSENDKELRIQNG